MRRALLVVAALIAAPSCDCGTSKAKPAQGSAAPVRDQPTTPRVTGPRTPTPRGPRDLPKGATSRAPITLEEAQAAIPTLEGARQLGAVAIAPNGAQARTSYCVDGDNIAVAGEHVQVQLQNAGWQRVTSRPPSGDTEPKQFTIVGEQGPLRVTATVSAIRRSGCDATVNQYFTTIAVQKIAPPAPAPAPADPED